MPKESSATAASAPYLRIERLRKRFGAFAALKDISLEIHRGNSSASSGRAAAARRHCCAPSPGSTSRRPAASSRPGGTSPPCRQPKRNFGIVFQSYALFPNLTVAAQRGLRAGESRRAQGRDRDPSRRTAAAGRDCPTGGSTRRSSRAASSSASRWRGRWRCRPACCCWTSRSPRSTPRARHLRLEIRACSGGSGVTTIMVTHDQEEALPWPTASW